MRDTVRGELAGQFPLAQSIERWDTNKRPKGLVLETAPKLNSCTQTGQPATVQLRQEERLLLPFP